MRDGRGSEKLVTEQQKPVNDDDDDHRQLQDDPISTHEGYSDYPSIPGEIGAVQTQAPSAVWSWGASVMGPPSIPSAHPLNSQAATGEFANVPAPPSNEEAVGVDSGQGEHSGLTRAFQTPPPREPAATLHGFGGVNGIDEGHCNPYVQMTPAIGGAGSGKSPMDFILENLNKFGKKAEDVTGNLWSHLTAGQSIADTAWGRLNLGAKVLTEGGLENVFKQTFEVGSNEQLLKSYACYLSTSTGPVVGTLYLSTLKIAFCSDRPLQHFLSPEEKISTYYKVVIPLERVKAVNASANPQKPAEKYIQIVTVDDHEFWFMGFVNYDKGLKNLQEAIQLRSFQ